MRAESVGPTWHDVEAGGAWGGSSVSVRGEAVVARNVHLSFLIIVGINWCTLVRLSKSLLLWVAMAIYR
jgi:hypothetical protein